MRRAEREGALSIARHGRTVAVLLGIVCAVMPALAQPQPGAGKPEWIRVSEDGRHFIFSGSGAEFRPWGFNYDHDASNRLLETYWKKEWTAVEGDFEEMKELGANTVRIHLQVSAFMKSADQTNRQSLDRLGRLLTLAENTGLYLDITGLGFVQRLTLDFAGRSPKQIAEAWVNKLVAAIRKHDRRHLITVGVIPWAMTWPNAKPLFYSRDVSRNLDFVSVHFYPKKDEIDKALKALAVYDIGKPIVIEEMFPLSCSVAELDQFIDGSKSLAAGWIGFYWGKTIAEYRAQKRSIADSITLEWLEYFAQKTPGILGLSAPQAEQPNDRKIDGR